ncbi:MAG: hypothetical protein ACPGU6_03005 [Tenacibaculum sp.]
MKDKEKSKNIVNAIVIGAMAGVVVWSILKGSVGLFTLIPLYFIYRLINTSKDNKKSK